MCHLLSYQFVNNDFERWLPYFTFHIISCVALITLQGSNKVDLNVYGKYIKANFIEFKTKSKTWKLANSKGRHVNPRLPLAEGLFLPIGVLDSHDVICSLVFNSLKLGVKCNKQNDFSYKQHSNSTCIKPFFQIVE